MDMGPRFVLLLLLSPLLILFIQMLLCRLFREKLAAQAIAVMAIILGYIPVIILIWRMGLLRQEPLATFFYSFIVYFCLGYSYFHVFNMSETARRIRILVEIDTKGKIELAQLRQKYGMKDMLQVRLVRLAKTGQIKYSNGRYFTANSILYYSARVLEIWRRFLKLESEGSEKYS